MRRFATGSPRSIALRERDLLGGREQLVAADVGEEELQAVGGAGDASDAHAARPRASPRLGLPSRRRRRPGGDLEPLRLELARELLGLLVVELVLDREGLELGRLDEAALLRALDEGLDRSDSRVRSAGSASRAVSVLSILHRRASNKLTHLTGSFLCSARVIRELTCHKPQRDRALLYSARRRDTVSPGGTRERPIQRLDARRLGGEPVRTSLRGAAALGFAGPFARRSARSSTRAIDRDALRIVAAAQAGVRLAVGHVRAEAAVLDHHRLAGSPGRPELLQRRLGGAAGPAAASAARAGRAPARA